MRDSDGEEEEAGDKVAVEVKGVAVELVEEEVHTVRQANLMKGEDCVLLFRKGHVIEVRRADIFTCLKEQ